MGKRKPKPDEEPDPTDDNIPTDDDGPPAKPDDVVIKIDLVCVGVTTLKEHKGLWPVFTRVLGQPGADALSKEPHETRGVWSSKAMRHATPGIVYRIDATSWTPDKQVVRPATLTYVRRYDDDAMRLRWETDARAERTAESAAREKKKAEHESMLRETLAPLRKLYQATTYEKRCALLANVINELTTWRQDK